MKVFISADIEGVATTLSHEDCRPGNDKGSAGSL